jgi:hypothetical protein
LAPLAEAAAAAFASWSRHVAEFRRNATRGGDAGVVGRVGGGAAASGVRPAGRLARLSGQSVI